MEAPVPCIEPVPFDIAEFVPELNPQEYRLVDSDEEGRAWLTRVQLTRLACPTGGDTLAGHASYETEACIILTGHIESDNKRWLHLSVATADGQHSRALFMHVKQAILGDRVGFHVCDEPERSADPRCMHAWFPVDDPAVIPDFAGIRGGRY